MPAGLDGRLRADALQIFDAALKAADPRAGVRAALTGYPLDKFRRVIVLGAGKASANMAEEVEHLLGDRIADGLINTKYGHFADLHRIRLNECGHPVPDEAGVRGSAELAAMASAAGPDDLVLVLISGGASALTPLPVEGVSLADKQATTSLLLASGANIHEINAVRKHLSRIKGGQLAKLAEPATVLSLILSDVIGDDLDVIGSGPTAPDSSTFARAWSVIEKYGLATRIPDPVRRRLTDPAAVETPKPGDPVFNHVENRIVGSNLIALQAAAAEARRIGYQTLVLSSTIDGETRDVAGVHAAIAREIAATGQPISRPACILSGGETTVTLKGPGKGGRNQEFVLAAALGMQGLPDIAVLSGGTDGTDGPTDAAGAVATGHSLEGRETEARQALEANDSWTFFDQTGDLIRTGPTGTNVADIRLILAGEVALPSRDREGALQSRDREGALVRQHAAQPGEPRRPPLVTEPRPSGSRQFANSQPGEPTHPPLVTEPRPSGSRRFANSQPGEPTHPPLVTEPRPSGSRQLQDTP